jgi:glycosidase
MNNTPDRRIGVLGIAYILCNLGVPCIYYGTEQGFDGGGDSDRYVREAMFGGTWGPFDTTGMHCFNPDHPIYKGIASIAKARSELSALRYGRQYFRDVSGDGENFGCPTDVKCTLAFSRILDTQEVLCALNLEDQPRNDWINVGYNQLGPGSRLVDVLDGKDTVYEVEAAPKGGAMVRVPLEPRQVKIMKLAT